MQSVESKDNQVVCRTPSNRVVTTFPSRLDHGNPPPFLPTDEDIMSIYALPGTRHSHDLLGEEVRESHACEMLQKSHISFNP